MTKFARVPALMGYCSAPLLSALALAGCADERRGITSPEPNLAVTSAGPGPSASGHANLTQAPGVLRTFSFQGRQAWDGSVSGTYVNHNRLGGVVNHGEIDCIRLIGANGAVLSGPTRKHTIPGNVGFTSLFRVEDNGEGNGGAADRITGLFGFPPGSGVNCQTFTPPAASLLPLEGGNIQVRQ